MRRALSLLVSMSWLLNACTSWQAEQVAPAAYIDAQHPGTVRLTLQDSTRLTLYSPVVMGDSIAGAAGDDSSHHAVDQRDVRTFEVRRTSAAKTVGLVLGVAAGLMVASAALFAVECSTACGN
jgi:hypothetical protein